MKLGLAQLGKQVVVMEQAVEFSEVGAGLQLALNGLRTLDKLGVLNKLYKQAVFPWGAGYKELKKVNIKLIMMRVIGSKRRMFEKRWQQAGESRCRYIAD